MKIKRKKYLVMVSGKLGTKPLSIFSSKKSAESFRAKVKKLDGGSTNYEIKEMPINNFKEEIERGEDMYSLDITTRYKITSCESSCFYWRGVNPEDVGRVRAMNENNHNDNYYRVTLWAKSASEAVKKGRRLAISFKKEQRKKLKVTNCDPKH
ncbi:MAG: hypothetical protein H8E05_00445 [Bacteroidetes bacterium]|nr:hypothetical protein [Bacteroidota bacterium]